MNRTTASMVLLVSAATAAAQPAPPPPLIALRLAPATAPVPALKYTLLPEVRDQNPGNAVQLYYRAFSPEWQANIREPKYYERFWKVSEKPLRDLTRAELNEHAWPLSSKMLKELDRAARRSYCDWELTERARQDGIGLLLPDLQSMRNFIHDLRLRAKLELLDGQFDKAAYTLQTGFAMGRHIADGPTLVQSLVGVACASGMLQVVEDWIDLPGSPNLYWALTDLPNPLIDLRPALQGERLVIDQIFPGYREMLADPEAAPPSAQQLQASVQKYLALIEARKGFESQAGPVLLALHSYPAAKRFLREHGRNAEQIEAMPVMLVVFLYEVHQYDVAYDGMRKWFRFPYGEAQRHLRAAVDHIKDEQTLGSRLGVTFQLIPAIEKVFTAPVRVERKIAALRCVEAIRLHMIAHGGKLPAKLNDVTEVPIPLDPYTGQAFVYKLDGDMATLSGPPPAGEMPYAGNQVHYVLTARIAKEGK